MKKLVKYCFFIGTQAELIKLLPVIREFEKRHIPFELVSSGQNGLAPSLLENTKISIQLHEKIFFPHMVWVLLWFFQTMIRGFFVIRKNLKREKNAVFIVHGDTISSLMGAILGRLLGYKIAHVEAGLRSFNYRTPFPEEIDRMIISRLTTYHFCPNAWSCNNLKKIKGTVINTQQNTLWEQFQIAVNKSIQLPVSLNKPYFLFVIHRQENLYNHPLMELLIREVLAETKQLNAVFILHEPTRIALEDYHLITKLTQNKRVILLPRQDYFAFTHIIQNCEFMVTDGGSNQEESYYLGKPCLLLRTVTERIEGLDENVVISKNDPETIHHFMNTYSAYSRKLLSSKTKPSTIIVDTLQNI